MKERHHRRREQCRLSGTITEDLDDLESHEDLSIDYSFDGVVENGDGIGQVSIEIIFIFIFNCRFLKFNYFFKHALHNHYTLITF